MKQNCIVFIDLALNYVNIIIADALAPCVTRSSAAMKLAM